MSREIQRPRPESVELSYLLHEGRGVLLHLFDPLLIGEPSAFQP